MSDDRPEGAGREGDLSGPLWVAGLAAVQLILVDWSGRFQDERREWAQFLLLGTLFPACVLALALAARRPNRWSAPARWLTRGLAAVGLLVCAGLAGPNIDVATVALVLAEAVVVTLVAGVEFRIDPRSCSLALSWRPPWDGPRSRVVARGLALALVLMASWSAASGLVWWPSLTAWLANSGFALLIALVALTLVTANLLRPAPEGLVRTKYDWLADVASLALFALASVRFDTFGGTQGRYGTAVAEITYFHWGALVGPVELVRQGGWLLWDVPSNYGFLSMLAVVAVPVANVWQAFYVVNAALTALGAALLYGLLRSLRPGPGNWLFAVSLTCAAVFLVPGCAGRSIGPTLTPAVGAFRFFWCLVLLAILAGGAATERGGRVSRRLLISGCLCWLAGTLWSCESAVYCAAIWLPAFAVLAVARAAREEGGPVGLGRAAARAAGWLAVPPLLAATTVGAIAGYYRARLGHGPDWLAFADYVRAAEVYALPIRPDGAVLGLLLIFCALSAVAARALGRGASPAALALAAGAWAAVWSTCSYFVGRSHDINALNLCPVLCMATAAVLTLMDHRRVGGRACDPVLLGLVPLLTVVLTVGFGDSVELRKAVAGLRAGYVRQIDIRRPVMDPALVRLLESAGVDHKAPMVYLDRDHMPARPRDAVGPRRQTDPPYWLPTNDFILYDPLPPDRRLAYLRRFMERRPRGGWLAAPKFNQRPKYYDWCVAELVKQYDMVEHLENDRWWLLHLERRGTPRAGAEAVARRVNPGRHDARLR